MEEMSSAGEGGGGPLRKPIALAPSRERSASLILWWVSSGPSRASQSTD